jgi:small GTP-binding protein
MKQMIIKVCVAGEGGTGKTTMLERLVSGLFVEDTKMTIGTGLLTHEVIVGNTKFVLQLWDFAGEPRFRFFLPNYLRGSSAVVLCFDITRFPTYRSLEEWYEIVVENTKEEKTVIYLVATKGDLIDQRAIEQDLIDDWIKDHDRIKGFYQTSSVTGKNIDELFSKIAEDSLQLRI